MGHNRMPWNLSGNNKRNVTFSLDAPLAHSVVVTGSFCNWQTESIPLQRNRKGIWQTTIPLSPGRYEYRFLVDGHWEDDPECEERVSNPFGSRNCVLHVLREFVDSGRPKVAYEPLP